MKLKDLMITDIIDKQNYTITLKYGVEEENENFDRISQIKVIYDSNCDSCSYIKENNSHLKTFKGEPNLPNLVYVCRYLHIDMSIHDWKDIIEKYYNKLLTGYKACIKMIAFDLEHDYNYKPTEEESNEYNEWHDTFYRCMPDCDRAKVENALDIIDSLLVIFYHKYTTNSVYIKYKEILEFHGTNIKAESEWIPTERKYLQENIERFNRYDPKREYLIIE